jgi:hypothetical protein
MVVAGIQGMRSTFRLSWYLGSPVGACSASTVFLARHRDCGQSNNDEQNYYGLFKKQSINSIF